MTLTIEEETELFFGFDHKKLAEEVIRTALEIEQFPYEAEENHLIVSLEELQNIKDPKSTLLNYIHRSLSRKPSSA